MANFAKAQLMKYGWTEGKGLGKNENGITEALRPKLKFDTIGIGHKETDSNQWWEAAFNKAASNVIVDSQSNGVTFSTDKKQTEQTKVKKSKGTSKYGNFLKTSTLCDGNLIQEESCIKVENEVKNVESNFVCPQLTDEELFKACGGRTAHKGARHGLRLNGKLARIAEQERKLLGTIISEGLSGSNATAGKKCNKYKSLKLRPESRECDSDADSNANTLLFPTLSASTRHVLKKYKKKQTRRIKKLTDQLDALCNINEGDKDTDHAPDNVTRKKEKQLKRKRSKDRNECISSNSGKNVTNEEVNEEICNIPLPPNEEVERKRVKQKKKKTLDSEEIDDLAYEQTEDYNDELIYAYVDNKKKKKSKRKRSHSRQSRHIVSTEQNQAQYVSKKLKKSHSKEGSNLEVLINEEVIESKYQTDSSLNTQPQSDEILDSTLDSEKYFSESSITHTKKTADFLNSRINKKKFARLRRKQRVKLERITKSLKAVHFDADVSPKEVNAKQKRTR